MWAVDGNAAVGLPLLTHDGLGLDLKLGRRGCQTDWAAFARPSLLEIRLQTVELGSSNSSGD